MAKVSHSIVLTFFFIFCITVGTVESLTDTGRHSRRSRARTFIEASCRSTSYPALCIKCLTGHINSTTPNLQQLARTALTMSLYRARYTRSYLVNVAKDLRAMKSKEYRLVRDCLLQIDDSVNQLSQSIRELQRLDPKAKMTDDIFWHIDNVDSWVSAALTDASSCVDEFPGHRMSKMKATIKSKVLNVAQLTSNALALFHQYSARYRGAAIEQHP
ncbi:ARM repeat superfamily protein, D,CHO [Hibiscus syriacus]|uniref:ARM repeat superfamily protein, D,CHO n=1 Tax=Hibiscus syriacus TaxID=106335 RepID=A0A6A2XM45_HIBSY|nr:pectinesterase inhibitor 9-like [Hibiscus syriacus]KAE8677431.1 ARM repeat superfamily protein, D,CHO [Hibiscus syriacus]